LDPTLTVEETIILRALAAGQTNRQVGRDLRIGPATLLRIMRDMREKLGTADNISLIKWVKRRIGGVDQRIDRPERLARPM